MNARICACGCGGSLVGLRADALYQSEACKKRAQRAASRDKAGTGDHPLQLVRDQAALDKNTRDLNGLIRQAIMDTIRLNGECHPDDLHDLYPAGEVDRCRELATRQFASLRSGKNPLIAERERRASSIPARKRGKSGVYVFTKHGRETLVGPTSCRFLGAAAGRSGENNEIVGVDDDHHGDGEGEGAAGRRLASPPSSVGVDPGDRSGIGSPAPRKGDAVPSPPVAADTGPSPDSLVQLDGARKAPSMYDPYEDAA